MTHRRSRSRSPRRQTGPLFLIIAASLVLLGGLGWTVWAVPSRDTAQTAPQAAKAAAQDAAPSARPARSQATQKILAQGVDLTGLSPDQAREKLEAAHPWKLTVSYGDQTYPIPNPLEKEMDRIIGAVSAAPMSQDTAVVIEYHFDYEAVSREIEAETEALAALLDRKPVDSQLESYDRATGVYQYSQAKSGRSLNREQLAADILEAARRQDYQAVITPVFKEIPPSRTQAQAKEQYQVIGTFTTRTTDNRNRNQNIRLAVEAIDGQILKPGEEFSFNQTTGNRTSEKGYQPAGAYKNGILIEEPGGGVCQVSTTLYHAIINSGFMTTERNSHSFSPSYVEPGQDAMVSFDGYAGPDLKFVNTQSTNVALRAAFSDNQLKLSIVGLPVLEKGVTVSIRSEKVNEAAPLEPVYEENPSLAQGVEKEVEKAKTGTEWRSYRVLVKDGQTLEEKPLHRSSYKGKAAVIQRGTADNTAAATAQEETTAAGNGGADAQGGAGNAAGAGSQDNGGNASGTGLQGSGGSGGSAAGAGSQGNAADAGSKGNSGNSADAGSQGNSGNSADTGSQGNSGSSADAGSQGNSADTGSQGNSGNSADTGSQGNSGNSADTGSQGNSGNSASPGSQGNFDSAASAVTTPQSADAPTAPIEAFPGASLPDSQTLNN